MTAHVTAKRSLILEVVAAALFLLLPINAAYAQQPEIVKTEVNYDTHTITTLGHHFGTRPGRAVLAGSRGSIDTELVIADWNDEHVIAYLPDGLLAGTYRLAIMALWNRHYSSNDLTGRAFCCTDMIYVTFCVAGAHGPAGCSGPCRVVR